MTKTPFLFLVISTMIFFVIFKRQVLVRNTIMGNGNGFIHYYKNETLHNNSMFLEYTDCRTLLLKYWNISLDETLLSSLAKACFQKEHASIESIFEKQLLQRTIGNTSCPTTKTKFLNESVPLVALASFPGSGNTWTRVLLQYITGIYTGSIYSDAYSYFKGSNRCPTKAGVFIVKTHRSSDLVQRAGCPKGFKFSRAIFLLRNPYDAFMAEFNRLKGGKVRFASWTNFTTNGWKEFVSGNYQKWGNTALYWMTTYNCPVHILFYESLKSNTMFETYKLMNFLNRNVTLQDLYCLICKQTDIFYRGVKPEWLIKTNLFDNAMKERINANIRSVYLKVMKSPKTYDILKSYILKTHITVTSKIFENDVT